jgi:TolB-like protein
MRRQKMRPSTSRTWIVALLALAALAPTSAQAPATVALSDFVVNSANPSFAYLGKGFAEIVAFEIRKAPQVRLVDREQRNKILEEMEFSLSGLTDPSAQLKIGKLLSVQFLVSGSITDMGGPLLVSLSMVDVQTGVVVWKDQLAESSGKYAYIGAYFGKSLLKHFKATVSKETEKTLAAAKEGDSASVVALSKGIEALDKGNKAEAKKQLTTARKIDPGNAVAQAFLDKLASASAKFKVVPERYVSYYNPAYLGGMEKDRIYLSGNYVLPVGYYDEHNDETIVRTDDLSAGAGERRSGGSMGYQYPVSAKVGFGIELLGSSWKDLVVEYSAPDYVTIGNQMMSYYGALASLGYTLSPRLSLGGGVIAAYEDRSYYEESWGGGLPYRDESQWIFGGLLAAVVRNASGSFSWDVEASWSSEQLHWFDLTIPTFVENRAPVYVEQTLNLALAKGSILLAVKQANDIYADRDLYYGRATPMAEIWLLPSLAVRAGGEGSLIIRDGVKAFGWGATGGLSIKVRAVMVDLNYTFRQRPARTLAEIVIPESIFFVTVSMDGLLRK